MPQQLKNDIPQEAFDWYDEYAHGMMDRRDFMKRLGTLVAVGYSAQNIRSISTKCFLC